MSSYLWKYYLEDDVDRFRHLLETAGINVRNNAQKGGGAGQNMYNSGAVVGSPSTATLGTSPTLTTKARKAPGWSHLGASLGAPPVALLTRGDINWRDGNGMTLLHHAASSTADNALDYAQALVEHPLVDLYLQDSENGWTALHRAFYFGNITVARAILERDTSDALGRGAAGVVHGAGGLIKIKDKEGLGPLDLYSATIKDRTLRPESEGRPRAGSNAASEDEHTNVDRGENGEETRASVTIDAVNIAGDEVYTFGSNKNITLGFGDEDDRQHPERITLRRPDHLLHRFYQEHVEEYENFWASFDPSVTENGRSTLPQSLPVASLPWTIKSRPLIIQDVLMSKLHTAVLTTDPESNLYMCGHGPGGRLGTGTEQTQFNFACIEGGALTGIKVATVALGQNHTLALSEEGELFSWGSNGYGQLGYSLPKTGFMDEDPIQTLPRQIFGPLKREIIVGVAASRIHSVAHTSSSLYTFGKNEGQLGIVDSDARSLEIQVTPRKVAASLFSSSIVSVTAIDRATICLLENHDVWVFTNYGYLKVQFPLDGFSNYFLKQSFLMTRYDTTINHICKVTAGGDTICAMSSSGEVYTVSVTHRQDSQLASASTTNPTKIRGAISQPHCIWSLKKGNMAARDVGVDADGSIILTTEEGSVWKRSRRAKIKDAATLGAADYKPKDYKFSRVSGLTRVTAVRASAYGAYAAIRRDCNVTKTQTLVQDQTIWKDTFPLLWLKGLRIHDDVPDSESEEPEPRFWQGRKKPDELQLLRRKLLESQDLEKELKEMMRHHSAVESADYDLCVATTVSEIRLPAHQVILAGRSRALRKGLHTFHNGGEFAIPDLLVCTSTDRGQPILMFQGLDVLTLVNLLLYCYTDTVVDYWHHTRRSPTLAFRYRQTRTELMKVAAKLDLHKLEPAVRQMVEPNRCLSTDMELAIREPEYFLGGDIRVQLADDEVLVHGTLVCKRCPFFEGLFMGRAGGRWLDERRGLLDDASDAIDVDLKHVDSSIFQMVLRHIYADTGEELFDQIVSADVDEFFDIVMDVMGVANELMLDRLSQICQKVIGRYVTARNVCGLLNAIAPSSVTEFKDASLEYMCLSLEAMLQGGLLDELDEDLLLELDGVVRDNQLACMPFAKSGRAESLLHERHPELAVLVDRNRQAKIDSITLHSKYQDVESWGPHSFRAHSIDDSSPAQQKIRRKSSNQSGGLSPALKGKAAVHALGTSIDEDVSLDLGRPALRGTDSNYESASRMHTAVGTPTEVWYDRKGRQLSPQMGTPKESKPLAGLGGTSPHLMPSPATPATSSGGAPWAASPSPGAKFDMKDIMTQASSSRVSNLSLGIAASRTQASAEANASGAFAKISQKERKKMQQQQQHQQQQQAQTTQTVQAEDHPGAKSASPWQVASAQRVPSLKDIIGDKPQPPPSTSPIPPLSRSLTPHLTMRQTIANPKPAPTKNVIGPASQHTTPQRSVSGSAAAKATPPTANRPVTAPSRPSPSPRQPASNPRAKSVTAASALAPPAAPDLSSSSFPSIQSIRHQPRPVEPSLQLNMSEILSQQQAEKDILREAAAARSLQDIQAEQEFQEWWDKESARLREEEDITRGIGTGPGGGSAKPPKGSKRGGGKSGGGQRGRGGGGGGGNNSGGGGKNRGGAAATGAAAARGRGGRATT
ncbi:hypothetical protein MBLNU459_g8416t1 [Dothideomycetes sp. NU459]